MLKRVTVFLFLSVFVAGCTAKTIHYITPITPDSDKNKLGLGDWQTSMDDSFSIKVPVNVKSGNLENDPLVPLYILDEDPPEKGVVYFSTHSLEETIKNSSWEFKINRTTIKDKSEIIPYLESVYGVTGCDVEYNEYPVDPNASIVLMVPKKPSVLPDDPWEPSDGPEVVDGRGMVPLSEDQMPCFVAGKVTTLYSEYLGKLITYQVLEPFFYEPGGDVSEEALASLRFGPTIFTNEFETDSKDVIFELPPYWTTAFTDVENRVYFHRSGKVVSDWEKEGWIFFDTILNSEKLTLEDYMNREYEPCLKIEPISPEFGQLCFHNEVGKWTNFEIKGKKAYQSDWYGIPESGEQHKSTYIARDDGSFLYFNEIKNSQTDVKILEGIFGKILETIEIH